MADPESERYFAHCAALSYLQLLRTMGEIRYRPLSHKNNRQPNENLSAECRPPKGSLIPLLEFPAPSFFKCVLQRCVAKDMVARVKGLKAPGGAFKKVRSMGTTRQISKIHALVSYAAITEKLARAQRKAGHYYRRIKPNLYDSLLNQPKRETAI